MYGDLLRISFTVAFARVALFLFCPTMSAYASEFPSVEFDAAYKRFFEEFYATSDTPDAHEKYIENFTKDALLIMASKKAEGSDGSLCYASPLIA